MSVPTVTRDFDTVPHEEGQVIRRHSRSFGFASRLLPPGVRSDVQRLYAWCRWCDDAVDSSDDPQEARRRLAILREDVERIYRKQSPMHPASAWLESLVAKYGIQREHALALLDGMETDVGLGQIRTQHELHCYCYRAAGVVGLMMCRVLGVTDPRAMRHAKSLGIAMQLTNIARDVREDWHLGRCYLPESWLPGGLDGSSQDEIRRSVRRILDLAEEHYQIGNQGIRYLPPRVRSAIRIAAAVYREIGVEIRRRRYQVLRGRTTVPKPRFALAAMASWSRGLAMDLMESFGIAAGNRFESRKSSSFSSASKEVVMNDAKYLFYLGISLTAFMSSAVFLLVMLNPKDASYSTLPIIYAAACLIVGILTNLLAKKAEAPVPVPARENEQATQT